MNSPALPLARFYVGMAFLITATAVGGFSFTYFGPIWARSYPDLPAIVHIHGWLFFLFYFLFATQPVLIATRHRSLHRLLGRISPVLVLLIAISGLMVLSLRVHHSMATTSDFEGAEAVAGHNSRMFWIQVGPLILSSLALFVAFYVGGIIAAVRGQLEAHKRLMIMAASVGLGAALFRLAVQIFGPGYWSNSLWALVTNLFIAAGMLRDQRTEGRIHPTYKFGLVIALAVELAVWPYKANAIMRHVSSLLNTVGETVSRSDLLQPLL